MNSILTTKRIPTHIVYNPQEQDGKKGFVSDNGEWLVQPLYDDVDVFREGVCWVKTGGKWGLINENGETLIKPQFDDAREFNDGYANVKLAGKWGVIDMAGRVIIEAQFDFIGLNQNGMSIVSSAGKYGFINTRNHHIIAPGYDEVYDFSEGFAAVRLNDLWGYIDENGVEVVKPQYAWVESFWHEGASFVKTCGEIGVLDLIDGRPTVSKPVYEAEDENPNDCEPKPRSDYYGSIDRYGNIVIKPKFQVIEQFKDGRSIVKIDDKWGIINTLGAYVVEPSPEKPKHIVSGKGISEAEKIKSPKFVKIKKNGKIGIADSDGNTILAPLYATIIWNKEEQVFTAESAEYADDCSVDSDPEIDDFDVVDYRYWNSSLLNCPKGKWGIYDKSGNTILPPTYSAELEFYEGLAAVSVGDKWGFINPAGEMVVAPRFEYTEDFKKGLGMAFAKENGHPCIIDIKGDYIVKPVYERLFFLNGNDGRVHGYICFTTSEGKDGIIDRNGRIVVEPKFYEILSEDTDLAEYWDGNVELFGVIDCKTGKATEPIFNDVACISHGMAVVSFSAHQIEAGIQNEPISFS